MRIEMSGLLSAVPCPLSSIGVPPDQPGNADVVSDDVLRVDPRWVLVEDNVP